MDNKMQDQI